jgi:hypothetical protein
MAVNNPALFLRPPKQVISIGDSQHEREALFNSCEYYIGKYKSQIWAKNLKFRERSAPSALVQQHVVLHRRLADLSAVEDNQDLMVVPEDLEDCMDATIGAPAQQQEELHCGPLTPKFGDSLGAKMQILGSGY